jgi:hypothetical protein
MSPDLTAEQWTQLLSLLSLDGALPLYEDMGVPVAEKDAFQKTLRVVIIEARRLYETNPNRVPSVAAMMSARLGSAAAEPFTVWARGIFLGYHADQPEWSAWDIVFSQWAYSRRKELDFLPQQKRDWLITSYREKANTDDIKQKGEEILKKPLSDWDLEMFARQGYGIAWESSPYSTAEAIVRIERLKRLVAELWPILTPDEREEVQNRGQALINLLRVWMPGPLPRLDVLLREL